MADAELLEIDCGDTLTIADVSKLYAELLVPLAEGTPVNLDVSNIERIDTAAVQLIYSFFREAQTQGHAIEWKQPSQAFRHSIQLLGLAEQMNINDNKE